MTNLERLIAWVDGYVRAWDSNDPGDIGALFTADASYRTAPFDAPWQGRQAIIDAWLARKDQPGDATFDWQPLVLTDELAAVQGTTTYRDPPVTYSNLWIIRLDPDGRCAEFTEWWMQHR